ncbi:MAG: hypothetical protein JWO99_624 [Candidatus Saccharibacteria bacterium]|nr:hypothetical protein [Candidatus Saccharibacteria bacterium]
MCGGGRGEASIGRNRVWAVSRGGLIHLLASPRGHSIGATRRQCLPLHPLRAYWSKDGGSGEPFFVSAGPFSAGNRRTFAEKVGGL